MMHAAINPQTAAGRTRRIAILIAVMWMLGLADLAMTLWASGLTCFRELNPLASQFLHCGWIPSVILLKLASIGTGSFIFWRLRRHGQSELALCALVLVHLLLAVRWSQFTMQALAHHDFPDSAIASVDE